MARTKKQQMKRLFEEGGLLQEGGAVDPVSGNDVPVGSTKEEVRDDIPAQLSEGEFVFPADVVRFIGLEKLMQIRQAAKEGLAKMERMGQMGNSDEATEDDTGEFETEIDDIISEIDSEGEDDDSEDEEVSSVKKPDEERLGFAIGGVAPPAPVYGMQRFTKEGEPDKYVPTTNDQLRLAAPEGFTKATETPGKVGKIDVGNIRQEALQTYKTKYAPKVEDVLGKPVNVGSGATVDSGLTANKAIEDQTKDLFGGVDIKGKKVEAGNIKSMLGEVDDEEGKTYTRDEAIARMTSQFRKQYDFLNKNAGYKYKHEGDLDTIFRKQAEELYDASGGTLASIYDVDIKEAEVPVDQRIRTDGTLIQEKDDEGNLLGTYAYYYEVPEGDGTRREVISGIKSDQVTADGNYIDPDAATTSKYIINKKTGEQIKLGKYEGAVQDWQGGFTRFGYNTGVEGMAHYGITKDKFGNPIYYPVYEDTSDAGKIAQIAGIGLSFLLPGAGTALGAALGAGATFAPIIGNALIQGTLSELSGGSFLKGAAIGAITGGTQTPAFKDFAGSVGASILGEGVKGAETLGAVITNASVNGVVAAITGADVGKSMLIGGIKGGVGANIEDITNSVIGANGTKAIADALNISTKEVQSIFGNSLVGGAVSLAQGKSYFEGFTNTLMANGLSAAAAGTIAKNLQGKTDPATLKRITNTTRLVTNLAVKAKQKGLDFETLLQAQWPNIVATSLKGIGGKG
jgi:hypothetical protein